MQALDKEREEQQEEMHRLTEDLEAATRENQVRNTGVQYLMHAHMPPVHVALPVAHWLQAGMPHLWHSAPLCHSSREL